MGPGRPVRFDKFSCGTFETALGGSDERWLRSPYHALLTGDADHIRRRLCDPACPDDFPVLADLRGLCCTDYLATITRFAPDDRMGEM